MQKPARRRWRSRASRAAPSTRSPVPRAWTSTLSIVETGVGWNSACEYRTGLFEASPSRARAPPRRGAEGRRSEPRHAHHRPVPAGPGRSSNSSSSGGTPPRATSRVTWCTSSPGPGEAHPRTPSPCLRGPAAHLRAARCSRQPARAPPARLGVPRGRAGRPLRQALARHRRRHPGHPQGERNTNPARPQLPGRAPHLHAARLRRASPRHHQRPSPMSSPPEASSSSCGAEARFINAQPSTYPSSLRRGQPRVHHLHLRQHRPTRARSSAPLCNTALQTGRAMGARDGEPRPQFFSAGFDASVWGSSARCSRSATLVLAPRERSSRAHRCARWPVTVITAVTLTPSVLAQLAPGLPLAARSSPPPEACPGWCIAGRRTCASSAHTAPRGLDRLRLHHRAALSAGRRLTIGRHGRTSSVRRRCVDASVHQGAVELVSGGVGLARATWDSRASPPSASSRTPSPACPERSSTAPETGRGGAPMEPRVLPGPHRLAGEAAWLPHRARVRSKPSSRVSPSCARPSPPCARTPRA